MRDFVAIDKGNRHFTRFMALLMEKPEVRLVELKRLVPRSRWYAVVVKKLLQANALLEGIDSKLYLAKPTFCVTKSRDVYTCVKRCEHITIETKPGYFIIRWNNGKGKNDTNTSNNGTVRADSEQGNGEGVQDYLELPETDSAP